MLVSPEGKGGKPSEQEDGHQAHGGGREGVFCPMRRDQGTGPAKGRRIFRESYSINEEFKLPQK